MQSENRLFDEAAKMMCKLMRSFCQLKKKLCKTEQHHSQSSQEKAMPEAKTKQQ